MRRPDSLITLALAVCALAEPPIATASLLRAMDLAELTKRADQIVVADVVVVHSAWDPSHRTICSTVEVDVQESWKGSPPPSRRISIRQTGGTVGEIEMTVHGMPRFSPGERALIFLERARVVGMGQGKRRLYRETRSGDWFAEGRKALRDTLLIGPAGRVATSDNDQLETLDSLREKVSALVGK